METHVSTEGWIWRVETTKKWTEVALGDHFLFIGTDGLLRKVAHGVDSGESPRERWDAAVAMAATHTGTAEEYVMKKLQQTFARGAKTVGNTQITPTAVQEADT